MKATNKKETNMPSITPSLWFDYDLEEAATFYTSVFPKSHIESFNRSTDAGPGEPGSVLSGSFVLEGARFIGINGGPHFARATAAAQAMYGMRKIVIADLEDAVAAV
jgi:predicted 3-demethylubiquinone-9 3-methyltransferase (glyoxalase superfamily)